MSIVAERSSRPDLPRAWARLERLAEEAALSIAYWKRRSQEAEDEIVRLRRSLEGLASGSEAPGGAEEELRRLRAENAALRSRMQQARTRVKTLLKRLVTLGMEP